MSPPRRAPARLALASLLTLAALSSGARGQEPGAPELEPSPLADAALIRVSDEVGFFQPDELELMEERLDAVAVETGFEVRVIAQMVPSIQVVQDVASELFRQEVERLGHYRVALVFIGVDRQARKGIVRTNLGAGMVQVMSREEAADLFLKEGEPFSPVRIRSGVEKLAARLEEWHTVTLAADKTLFQTERPWYHQVGIHFYPLLFGAVLAGFLAWAAWRSRFCPRCGAGLRTRVRLGGPGAPAVRTAKCFKCGFVNKRRLRRLPILATVLGGGRKERGEE